MQAPLTAAPGKTSVALVFFVALGGNEQFGTLGCRLPADATAGLHATE
jgi:hypothetical protein